MSARVLDRSIAAVLLAVVSPLVLVLMALNFLMTGRVFFRQVRLGRNLKPFVVLKFQTMVDRTDAGSTITVARDPRITRYGSVLRALKLDELPQLVNIVRGQMNLVGPRPLTPNEVEVIPRHLAAAVYRTTPGLTGISALAFANEEYLLAHAPDPERTYFNDVLPRKIALELAYAHRRTWVTDLIVMLFTPLAPFLPGERRRVVSRLLPDCDGLVSPAAQSRT